MYVTEGCQIELSSQIILAYVHCRSSVLLTSEFLYVHKIRSVYGKRDLQTMYR